MKLALIILLIVTTSCSTLFQDQNDRAVARVDDVYLYESDLAGLIPPGTPAADSLSITRTFIDGWIRQQLLVQQAEKNLADRELDFTKQLEEYRNSLVIYAYEKALIGQNLDTLVTEDEMQAYYDTNQNNFQLRENIVQFQYIKLSNDKKRSIPQFKKLLNSGSQADQTTLSELCEKEAADYFLDDQNWISFTDLLKQIPIGTYNQEEFLKNHRDFEYQDSLFIYLVRFRDFRIRESVSPYSYEKTRIRNIILNKRKTDLLSRMRNDLYDNAVKKSDFEIY